MQKLNTNYVLRDVCLTKVCIYFAAVDIFPLLHRLNLFEVVNGLGPPFVVKTFQTFLKQLGYQLLLCSHLMKKLGGPHKFKELFFAWISAILLSYVLAIKKK
jgi:hypothetical protein